MKTNERAEHFFKTLPKDIVLTDKAKSAFCGLFEDLIDADLIHPTDISGAQDKILCMNVPFPLDGKIQSLIMRPIGTGFTKQVCVSCGVDIYGCFVDASPKCFYCYPKS